MKPFCQLFKLKIFMTKKELNFLSNFKVSVFSSKLNFPIVLKKKQPLKKLKTNLKRIFISYCAPLKNSPHSVTHKKWMNLEIFSQFLQISANGVEFLFLEEIFGKLYMKKWFWALNSLLFRSQKFQWGISIPMAINYTKTNKLKWQRRFTAQLGWKKRF